MGEVSNKVLAYRYSYFPNWPRWRAVQLSVRKLIHPAFTNFHPAATREADGLCGNQRYRRELQMRGIMVPETC